MDPAAERGGVSAAPNESLTIHAPASGPVTAWRYWGLGARDGRLRSVARRRFVWDPGRPLRAACDTGGHRAPAPGCGCGIYGAASLEALRQQCLCLPPECLVVGEVRLWGDVVAEGGEYRAATAYPQTLSAVRETVAHDALVGVLEALAAYGVPVDMVDLEQAVGDVAAAVIGFQRLSGG